jgi:large subunit ribosomal protein L18
MRKDMLKAQSRQRRHWRVRARVIGTAERPRLNVFRSNKYLYVQVIDDSKGHTLASASTIQEALSGTLGAKTDTLAAAKLLGTTIANRAKEKGIKQVAFDRGGYRYHGRIKAIADAAREAGLEF